MNPGPSWRDAAALLLAIGAAAFILDAVMRKTESDMRTAVALERIAAVAEAKP